ncbi:MAG TPA: HD domain-containing protein [Candidatus Peribacteraceae bacterium]|nr:HD domain-containing protein [Candidatus Peribacteraceae bacterium]
MEFLHELRHFPSNETDLIKKAFEMGEKAHAGQTRASGEPYFTHPIAVALILSRMNADCETIIAALLHDTIEDTPLTIEEIEKTFGRPIANLIDGVTKLDEGDISVRPSVDQKIETLRKMFTQMEEDVRIMVIKLADRLHNMQTIGFRSEEKQRLVARETLDVYVKVADRLCMRDLKNELETLCRQVLDPDTTRQLLLLRRRNMESAEEIIAQMKSQIESHFGNVNLVLLFELKSFDKLQMQFEMERDGLAASISAINIACVCESEDACYRTLGMLHRLWPREIQSFDDYINAPVINGYRALHTNVILENGKRVRCKIRTREMQEYAHAGITLMCFDHKEMGTMEYLSWTQRIAPLSKDTKDQSREFWNSLQSDILGESITIHGESDQSALLPKGSTALDGVFYLYGKKGLNTEHVRVNGKEVPFYSLLEYGGQTVQATFSKTPQSELRWLQYVHTGIAIALIREGLAEEVNDTKIARGKTLLQNYLHEQRRGFVQEFKSERLQENIRKHGYESLDDLYIRLAEGRMRPQDADFILFPKNAPQSGRLVRRWHLVRVSLTDQQRRIFFDAMHMYELKNVHVQKDRDEMYHYRCHLLLSDDEADTLKSALEREHISPFQIRKESALLKASLGSIALFVLWGLDPVAARILLHEYNVTPIDLTIVRFLSLSVISGLFFLWMRSRRAMPEKRLSLANTSLWLSVIFLFLISLTSYYALQQTYPSHYSIPMTAAGLVMTTIVNRRRKWMLLSTWLLMAIGIAVLIKGTPSWSPSSIVMMFLAVVSFTGFSYVSEKYKRQEEVSLRVAQYFFIMSVLCTLFSLMLLPYATIHNISLPVLFGIIGFSIFISGVPYYIYYQLLSHKEIDFVLRYSFLIIPCTLLAQEIFLRQPGVWTLISAIIVMLGAMIPVTDLSWMKKKKTA